ncbi:MAG: DUF4465 domain-containing protein [Phycisphaerales bacterium]|nr:DUF4465 domain-containing protein [Phycisphaerales bacterium]
MRTAMSVGVMGVLGAGLLAGNARGALVVDFEDLELPPQAVYYGADGAGGFTSRGAAFHNEYTDFGGGFFAWQGWAYSNITDNTTAGFGNQWSAWPGGGADGSGTYGVAFVGAPRVDLPVGTHPVSVQLTNTTYAGLAMRHGDAFSKKFGGPTGADPDFFLLTITGLDAAGAATGVVEFYLADFRFDDHASDYIVAAWTDVDLTALGAAVALTFELSSTDLGPFGMNTPAYFALDNLVLTPEPAGLVLFACGALVLGRRR